MTNQRVLAMYGNAPPFISLWTEAFHSLCLLNLWSWMLVQQLGLATSKQGEEPLSAVAGQSSGYW
jgi:hypothetical protein